MPVPIWQEGCFQLTFNQMVKYPVNTLDHIFSALSDSTRRHIIKRLAEEGDLRVTDLAEPFEMSLPAVSKHLRVLERAGLLVQEKDGRIRCCQLVPEPLHSAADWIDQYRHFWDSQFDALAEYLAGTQVQNGQYEEEHSSQTRSY